MPQLRVLYTYPKPAYTRLWIRWLSIIAAASCFAWVGFVYLERYVFQVLASHEFERPITAEMVRADPTFSATAKPRTAMRPARLKLNIPRLHVSGFVEDGFGDNTLRHAIGRAPWSARPGEHGNVVLAAHRDTFFAGLREVKLGDRIDLRASDGRRFSYQVSNVLLVEKDAGWVMHSEPGKPMITLITCYPFGFVGQAPQRLVVQADPISTLPAGTVVAGKRNAKQKENQDGR